MRAKRDRRKFRIYSDLAVPREFTLRTLCSSSEFCSKTSGRVLPASRLQRWRFPRRWPMALLLSSDAKASIPHDVQQIIVVDYRAMQNSSAAMSLKDRVTAAGAEAAGVGADELRTEGGPGCRHACVCGVPRAQPRGQGADGSGLSALRRASSTPRTSWPTSPRTRPSRPCCAITAFIRWDRPA